MVVNVGLDFFCDGGYETSLPDNRPSGTTTLDYATEKIGTNKVVSTAN